MRVKVDVPLAPLTTLRLGGPAARVADVERDDDVREVVRLAAGELFVLGGGSNLVVADQGYGGLVARMCTRGVAVTRDADRVVLDVAAGEHWDDLVALTVAEGWSGLECLSGIPGRVGATPIQNVGAYGQEVADVLTDVEVFDRLSGDTLTLRAADCRFTYRHSRFKEEARWIVLRARFALQADGVARPLRYAELARALAAGDGARVPLARVRETVLGLRRAKGMVLDASDPESVSAGSFFTNPVVSAAEAESFDARVAASGVLPGGRAPRFATGEAFKLSAGWLVEHAGFPRGTSRGRVGISRRHALALVNRGGSTADLLALAREVRDAVLARFGVTLVPEPVLLGVVW